MSQYQDLGGFDISAHHNDWGLVGSAVRVQLMTEICSGAEVQDYAGKGVVRGGFPGDHCSART